MTSSSNGEHHRDSAQSEALRLLGVDSLGPEALFALAAETLTPERAARCVELARLARLTERAAALSAIAELVFGVRSLGIAWWTQVHQELRADQQWVDCAAPDQLLADDGPNARFSLATLGNWIADDSADQAWGRPIDTVDLNDPAVDDRVVLPHDAKAGERFVAAWDPGCRVDVLVVARNDRPDEHHENT